MDTAYSLDYLVLEEFNEKYLSSQFTSLTFGGFDIKASPSTV